MFIDIHAHAYRVKPFPKPWNVDRNFCTAEELIARYDELGIEKGAVLPIVSPEVYSPQTNEEVLEMVEKYPDRLFAFCNVDPRMLTNRADAPLDWVLSYYKDKGCKGLGEVMPNLELMDPLVQNLFKCAEKVGLPVTYDGSDQKYGDFGLYDDPGLPQLEHTLQKFPDLKIMGHGPVFWAEIGRLKTTGSRGKIYSNTHHWMLIKPPTGPIEEEGAMVHLMRNYPNLYGDLSDGTPYMALTRDPDFGAKFLTEFQDRLMYGTDMVNNQHPVDIGDLLVEWRDTGRITETVFNKIARENAIRIYELDK